MSVNLAKLSLKELKALRGRVDSAITRLEASNLTKARIEAANLAKSYGVPLQALVDEEKPKKPTRKNVRAKRGKVAPKYRHPDDATLTWSGRGLRPKWVVSLTESGKTLEDFKI